MSEFGDALRDAIKMRGMSQRQLGMNIGVSECAVSKYVAGTMIPRKKRIASIEQSLGLERGTLQRCADADKINEEDDDETREEKILKAWKRGERTPYEVAEITKYPIKIVKKYLPLGLER